MQAKLWHLVAPECWLGVRRSVLFDWFKMQVPGRKAMKGIIAFNFLQVKWAGYLAPSSVLHCNNHCRSSPKTFLDVCFPGSINPFLDRPREHHWPGSLKQGRPRRWGNEGMDAALAKVMKWQQHQHHALWLITENRVTVILCVDAAVVSPHCLLEERTQKRTGE